MRAKRALLFALLITALLGSTTPSGGDATGCSYYNGTPGFGGCRSGGGSCYECLYSRGGFFSLCYENGEGSVAYCIDYQIP